MADRPEMFAPTRGFSGMADSMEPCTILWATPVAMTTTFRQIWAIFRQNLPLVILYAR